MYSSFYFGVSLRKDYLTAFFHLLKAFLMIIKKLRKYVPNFIQEFLALKRTGLFKQKGSLSLNDCFNNMTWTLLWEKSLDASIFQDRLFVQWRTGLHLHTIHAPWKMWLQSNAEALKSDMEVQKIVKSMLKCLSKWGLVPISHEVNLS